ncbi:MAG: hypothetical protein ACJ754_11700 [Pyrinomonadaceae bacterium]
MRTPLFLRRRLLASLLFASLATVALCAPPKYVMASDGVSTAVAYRQVKTVKPGMYPGRIIFADRDKNKVDGKATLEVSDGQRFSLVDHRNVRRNGTLVTRVDGFPGGYVQFEDDRRISIKWVQDEAKPARLKIVNASGECIRFRFCSDAVTDWECDHSLNSYP